MTAKNGKPCGRCGTSAWYEGGRCKECARQWQRNNPDKVTEAKRNWAQANPDKIAEKNRRWQQMNPQKTAVYNRRWLKSNPDKNAAKSSRRRTMQTGAGGSYTSAEWKDICTHYGNKCLRCGRDDVKLTADHIRPVSKGGTSAAENIQPLCLSCNDIKGAKIIDYRPDAGPLRWLQAKLFG